MLIMTSHRDNCNKFNPNSAHMIFNFPKTTNAVESIENTKVAETMLSITSGGLKRKIQVEKEDDEPVSKSRKFDNPSADVPKLFGKLVKKPLQSEELINPGDDLDAVTTWQAFQDLIPDLSKKSRSWSKRSKVKFVKKPGQQDAPFDLEPLVTHLGQMIDGGEFDPPLGPPCDILVHREKMRLALLYIREMRLSFTKHKFVDLMNHCDVYVSAIIELTGQGMINPDGKSSDPDQLLVGKCLRYLEAAKLKVIHPLPAW